MSAREAFPTAFALAVLPKRAWQAFKSMARNLRDNPVIAREGVPRVLRRLEPRWKWLLLGSAVAGCAAAGPVLGAGLRDRYQSAAEDVGIVLMASWLWIGGLVSALSAAGSVSKERAAGTWDLLIVTRLGKWGALAGKFLAIVLPISLVGSCLCLLALGIAWGYSPYDLPVLRGVVSIWLSGVATIVVSALVGLFWSCRCSAHWASALLTLFTLWLAGPVFVLASMAITGGRWP